MTPKILIVGNICKDIIYSTDSYPAEDRKVKALSKETRIGGNAGNIAQVLSQLKDCLVDCCVKLGSCEFSKYTKSSLERTATVRLLAVVEQDMDIPESVVLHSNETGSRTCLHFRGNCNDLNCDEVFSAVRDLRKYQWIHLEHRRNGLEVLKIAKEMKRLRPDVVLSIDIEKIRDGLEDMLGIVDFPIVSKEVCKILGFNDLPAALSGLSNHCSHALVVTWGDKGAGMWLAEGISELAFSNDKLHEIDDHTFTCDAHKVDDIVDSCGAGDCFTAGFLYCASHLDKTLLSESVASACKLAASKLGHPGMTVDTSVLKF